jgi:hypothetical protein
MQQIEWYGFGRAGNNGMRVYIRKLECRRPGTLELLKGHLVPNVRRTKTDHSLNMDDIKYPIGRNGRRAFLCYAARRQAKGGEKSSNESNKRILDVLGNLWKPQLACTVPLFSPLTLGYFADR